MKEYINNDNKTDILLAALDERYKSIHAIRERVQSIGVWALGILFGTGGWLIQSGVALSSFEKGIYLFGVVVAFIVLRFYYLEDLCKGFKNQLRITARLEKTLGLFSPNFFDSSDTPIYPKEWEKSGTQEGNGNFFYASYLLIYVGIVFLVIAILSSNCSRSL